MECYVLVVLVPYRNRNHDLVATSGNKCKSTFFKIQTRMHIVFTTMHICLLKYFLKIKEKIYLVGIM